MTGASKNINKKIKIETEKSKKIAENNSNIIMKIVEKIFKQKEENVKPFQSICKQSTERKLNKKGKKQIKSSKNGGKQKEKDKEENRNGNTK